MKGILRLLLSSALTPTILAFVCYTPDGQDRNENFNAIVYEPCNTSASVSMCCATGPGRTAGTLDTCMPDSGLCFNQYYNNYWRESCTDSTWKDPACIKLFVNGTGFNGGAVTVQNGNVINDVELTPCDDGSYCDGGSNLLCCQQGLGYFIKNGTQTRVNPKQTSSTPTASSSPSASPSSSASSGGLSTGAKAGIGVGVAIAVLAIIAFAFFFISRRRSRRQNNKEQAGLTSEITKWQDASEMTSNPESTRYQLSTDHEDNYKAPPSPYVMGGSPVELPGNTGRQG